MTKLIELDSIQTIAIHGNLWNSPSNQIRRKIGRHSLVDVGHRSGTVRDSDGKCWDWWFAADEKTVVVVEAR